MMMAKPRTDNLPRGAGDSIGWCQQTRGGRRRASAAATYLRPAKKRANLQIVTNALVHRVVFDSGQTEFKVSEEAARIRLTRVGLLAPGNQGQALFT